MDKCPICDSLAKIQGNRRDYDYYLDYDIECFRCGKFNIIMWKHVYNMKMFKELKEIKQISKNQIANISGWIRERQGSKIYLTEEKLKHLMTLKTPSVSEKADKILIYLAKQFPVAGMEILNSLYDSLIITVRDKNGKEFWSHSEELSLIVGVGYIISSEELNFIWKEYLITMKKFISSEQPRIITPKGWAYLASLRQQNPESKKAFVAMWFESEMEIIYDKFIKKAIEVAGYKPIQIGRKEHNNDINDEIIGEIRNSKFVVADFTGNRGGVYYEAGFAYGLKIEVIYTCRKDWWDKEITKKIKAELKNKKKEYVKIKEKRKVHFDLNHRKFIVWKDGKDLYDQLLKRIKATIT